MIESIIKKQLSPIVKRLDKIEKSIDKMDQGISKDFVEVNGRLDKIESRITSCKENLYSLNRPTSKIIREDSDYGDMYITSCCKVGPIVNENYCPKCGNKLIR